MEKPAAHLEDSFSEFLLPGELLKEVVIEFHVEGHSIDVEHSNVLEDNGNVLPILQAAREQGHSALDASLRCLPGHRGSCGHLAALERLQLPMG